MNEAAGKNYPSGPRQGARERGDAARGAVRILVVDPVVGSRFALLQAASQPGFVVDASSDPEDALRQLESSRYALVIADEAVGPDGGVEFLARLQSSHPETCRALVSERDSLDFKRAAIARADLSFLLGKPFSAESLRRTLRELFAAGSEYASWARIEPGRGETLGAATGDRASRATVPHHEILLRGLLAGLNSCESESEIFELLHSELTVPLGVTRWLWLDEQTGKAGRLSGDWAVETDITLDRLGADERTRLERAGRSLRVARLEPLSAQGGEVECCIGWALRFDARRALTGLVWSDLNHATALVSMLRGVQGGLQMAFQRIRDAERRAAAARALARRVSEELRMPVGALTHAIDRLRGEAERAGLSSEWVDRISSESERVARAVEHLEGEMLAAPRRGSPTPG